MTSRKPIVLISGEQSEIPNGDALSCDVVNTPAGNIVATTVQAAINELDTEKEAVVNKSTDISASPTSDTLYPTNKAVHDLVSNSLVASQTYMFSGTNSDISGYESMPLITNYTAGALATKATIVTTSPTLLEEFATPLGYPNTTILPAGQFTCHFETQKAAGSNNYFVFFELYKRTSGGVETLLLTSDNSTQTSVNTIVQHNISSFSTNRIDILATDRLVVKIYGQLLSSTATIDLLYDDNTDARFTTPAVAVDDTQLVHTSGDETIAGIKTFSSTIVGNVSGTASNVTGIVAAANGGTGLSSATAYAVLCGGTTSTGSFQSIASVGTSGQVLTSNGAGALPTFQDAVVLDANKQLFTGGIDFTAGTTTQLTLSTTPTSSEILEIYFDGVYQNSDTWSLAGAVITFTSAIPTGTNYVECHYGSLVGGGGGGAATSALSITKTGNYDYPFNYKLIPSFNFVLGSTFINANGKWIETFDFPNTFNVLSTLTSITFNDLIGINQLASTSLPDTATLSSISFPALKVVSGGVGTFDLFSNLSNPTLITTFDLSALQYVTVDLSLYNTGVSSIDLSALLAVEKSITISNHANLLTIDMSNLTFCGEGITVSTCSALTTIDLTSLQYNLGNITVNSLSALTTITLGTSLKKIIGNFNATGCALTQAIVDDILVKLAALDGTGGTTSYDNWTVNLSGGTSATPSATGIAAAVVLTGRGCTVTTN